MKQRAASGAVDAAGAAQGEVSPGSCAIVASRAAALLRGGVAARQVFALLGEAADESGPTVAAYAITQDISVGADAADAIAARDGPDWRLLAAAWSLAERTGAPLASALERIAVALQQLDVIRERRGVLLAAPRATTRMIAALPPLALVLGWCLGFDPFPVLLSGTGVWLAVVGAALLCAGVAWAESLTRSLSSQDRVAGCELELAWVAVAGGSSPEGALRSVIACVDQFHVEWVPFARCCQGQPLADALARAASLGIPLGPLLLEEAEAARAHTRAVQEAAAERLGVRVLVPLGVCVLPAFIVLGVMPIVITMLSGSGLVPA